MKALKPFEVPQRTNQFTGFYMSATLALNGLRTMLQSLEDCKASV